MAEQRGIGPRRPGRQAGEGGGGGEFRPMRRPQAGDPAALLVHQDRRLGTEQLAQLRESGRGAGRASSTLRANRMAPSGGVARNSAASSAVNRGPAIPTMAARGRMS